MVVSSDIFMSETWSPSDKDKTHISIKVLDGVKARWQHTIMK